MTIARQQVQTGLTAPGQPFEMEEVMVDGQTIRAWKNAPATFRALLERSRGYGDRDFLVYDDERITFEEHFRRVATLAGRLVDDYGIRKGDRIAIAMRNYPEWIIAFSATLAAGAIAVPLNAWWTGPELDYALRDSGATLLIADGERARRLSRADLPMIVTRTADANWSQVLGEIHPDVSLPPVDLGPDDPATIFYTSGTTGQPKGALGSHRNLGQAPMTVAYASARGAALAGREPAQTGDTPRVNLLTIPLFHATGCFAVLMTAMLSGASLVLMYKWDPLRALELIERERVTTMLGVPTNAWQLLSHPLLGEHDVSSLSAVSYGGAPAPPKLLERLATLLPGRTLSNGYGMTETTALAVHNIGQDYLDRPDSVGHPLPVVDAKVCDPSGAVLPPGQIGELYIRGPIVIMGYWNQPEATAETFVDGWVRTGDLARIDEEGFVYVVDRAKDVVIRGGENVYCAEVEAALFEHPAVEDAAVIGLPHDELGEEVGAVVRTKPGAEVTTEDLQRFLRERLAAFKVPVRFWFRTTELPRNPSGKLLKTRLRAETLGR